MPAGFSISNSVSDSGSRSVGSTNFDHSKRLYDLERKEILHSKIRYAYIGWEALTNVLPEFGFRLSNSGVGEFVKSIKASILPGKLGGGIYLYHASIFVYELDPSDGICIEYGIYDNDGLSDNHVKHVHYWRKNGLRFSKMSFYHWQNNFVKYKKEINNKTLKVNVGNPMTIEELFIKCTKYNSFQSSDYAVGSNNCQDFVGRCIKELRLTRPKDLFNRGNHLFSMTEIPYQLLVYLEEQEKDWTNYVGNVPFVWNLVNSMRGFFGLFTNN